MIAFILEGKRGNCHQPATAVLPIGLQSLLETVSLRNPWSRFNKWKDFPSEILDLPLSGAYGLSKLEKDCGCA